MTKTSLVAAAVALGLVGAVQAAPQVYFGEDQNPGFAVIAGRAPATARAEFLGQLTTGVANEGFERFAVGSTAPLNLSFAGSGGSTLLATLSAAGQISNTNAVGRFNTTPGGNRWWDSVGSFTINFATAVSAFGFYGSDIGDVNGRLTIDLTDTAGATTRYIVPNTQNGNDGSLLFWGFVDRSAAYTQVTFGNTSGGFDGFGFDDMVIGDRGQIGGGGTPEPGSLALAGLALAGLAAATRRRSRG
jgi:PEP-CTERM motif